MKDNAWANTFRSGPQCSECVLVDSRETCKEVLKLKTAETGLLVVPGHITVGGSICS